MIPYMKFKQKNRFTRYIIPTGRFVKKIQHKEEWLLVLQARLVNAAPWKGYAAATSLLSRNLVQPGCLCVLLSPHQCTQGPRADPDRVSATSWEPPEGTLTGFTNSHLCNCRPKLHDTCPDSYKGLVNHSQILHSSERKTQQKKIWITTG